METQARASFSFLPPPLESTRQLSQLHFSAAFGVAAPLLLVLALFRICQKMCTVLQQVLARQMTNGFETPDPEGSSSIYPRQPSPMRLTPQPTYSYLGAAQDGGFSMKRPVDPYDRKKSAPAMMHFHVPPPNPDGTRPSSRSRNSYSQQLWGRSRSHSRTGMRVLVAELKSSTPRSKSPHMNNEEPISFSHYPDGHPPNDDEVDEVSWQQLTS